MGDNIEQYEKQIEYGLQIQARISKIHNAMEVKQDPTRQFTNLITYLNSEILDPIKPKLKAISEKHAKLAHDIVANPNYPETFSWSRKHKTLYLNQKLYQCHYNYINECLPIIMDRLKELGILGRNMKQASI